MKSLRRFLFGFSSGVLLCSALLLGNNSFIQVPTFLIGIVAVAAFGVASITGYNEVKSWQLPDPEEAPKHKARPKTIIEKAEEALEEAQDLSSRTEKKVKIKIDSEDTPPQDIL